MRPIIKVENLSKQYRIGARRNPHPTLRESIAGAVRAPLNWLGRNGHSEDNTIWALKDLSFEVMPGEVVGIIGRNGAGKSTLLKILSRITEPTTGQVDLYGRVGSLLEVGTGFHTELSGRENIYLNGAILGMNRSEIDRKFDEIVAFAEVEKFIDTPVKQYSSGMYMRLAFAVAAHLEPEILVVDEVLAVGDAAFQKKCLGKMEDVAREGRTVLFVSHNMGAVSNLCKTGMFIDKGKIAFLGNVQKAIDCYNHKWLGLGNSADDRSPHIIYDAPENAEKYDFAVTKIEALDTTDNPKVTIATWDDVTLRVWYSCKRSVRRGSVVLEIAEPYGARLLLLSTQPDGTVPLEFRVGEEYVDCVIRQIPLAAGDYILGAGLAIPQTEWLWREPELSTLSVVPRDVYGSGLAPALSRSLIAVDYQWRSHS